MDFPFCPPYRRTSAPSRSAPPSRTYDDYYSNLFYQPSSPPSRTYGDFYNAAPSYHTAPSSRSYADLYNAAPSYQTVSPSQTYDNFYNAPVFDMPPPPPQPTTDILNEFLTPQRAYQPPPVTQPRSRALPRRSVPKTTPSMSEQEPRKVTPIPVKFVEKKKHIWIFDYAVRIQKVFRGFRVRKNVKKIMDLKRAIDAVERSFSNRETVELIKISDFERLKLNEELMALLLKLDAVVSCNDAVKICRKAVVRKAIMLQERIDSFAAAVIGGAETLGDEDGVNCGGVDDSSAMQVEYTVETADESEESNDEIAALPPTAAEEESDGITVEEVEEREESNDAIADSCTETTVETLQETLGTLPEVDETAALREEEMQVEKVGGEAECWECVGEEEPKVEFIDVGGGNIFKQPPNDEWFVIEEESKECKKLREMMAENNRRMEAKVDALSLKNAEQARLIDSLIRRVELLEQRR